MSTGYYTIEGCVEHYLSLICSRCNDSEHLMTSTQASAYCG